MFSKLMRLCKGKDTYPLGLAGLYNPNELNALIAHHKRPLFPKAATIKPVVALENK